MRKPFVELRRVGVCRSQVQDRTAAKVGQVDLNEHREFTIPEGAEGIFVYLRRCLIRWLQWLSATQYVDFPIHTETNASIGFEGILVRSPDDVVVHSSQVTG